MNAGLETLKFLVSLIGLLAAIYNIVSSRTHAQEQGQKAKLDQALAQCQENKKDIAALEKQLALHKEANNEHLEHLRADVSFVKDLLVKWLLDPARKS
jgi:hypothetical protein